jgi:sortase A
MGPTFLPTPVGPRPRGRLALLSDCLRRPGGRRAVTALTAVLFLAGVGMFAYPVFTDIFAKFHRGSPSHFASHHYQQQYLQHKIKVGQDLTRLVMPKIHVSVLVVEGVTTSALEAGAGHYPKTPLPCAQGNVAIAGHRTTYGRPFNQLDKMGAGDTAVLYTPFHKCTYRAVAPFAGHPDPWVVLPTAIGVVGQTGKLGSGHWLTLTTCTPKGSASHRLILRLKLVKSKQLRPTPGSGHAGKHSPPAGGRRRSPHPTGSSGTKLPDGGE